VSEPNTILSWPWEQVLEVYRLYGREIGTLAMRGDKLARRVVDAYQYAYDHPRDVAANRKVREMLDEYLKRDLRPAERSELGSRLGHIVDMPARVQ